MMHCYYLTVVIAAALAGVALSESATVVGTTPGTLTPTRPPDARMHSTARLLAPPGVTSGVHLIILKRNACQRAVDELRKTVAGTFGHVATIKDATARAAPSVASSEPDPDPRPAVRPAVADGRAAVGQVGQEAIELTYVARGWIAVLDNITLHAVLASDAVAYVEEDVILKQASRSPAKWFVQPKPHWALDRIDQRGRCLDGMFRCLHADTLGATSSGGAHLYLLDSSLRASHTEFGDRVARGFDVLANAPLVSSTVTRDETGMCSGHATHTAALAIGATVGVARSATLHPLRVVGCSGKSSVAAVVMGIEWMIANHKAPAVALVAISGGPSMVLDEAVRAATKRGIHVVVAAGNEASTACQFSPARIPEAIAVGSSDEEDSIAGFSNRGVCVGLYAPGVAVLSAYSRGDEEYARMSGTSASAALVAGLALTLAAHRPYLTPRDMAHVITCASTNGALSLCAPDCFNRMLYMGFFEPTAAMMRGSAGVRMEESCVDHSCESHRGQLLPGKQKDAFFPRAEGFASWAVDGGHGHRAWLTLSHVRKDTVFEARAVLYRWMGEGDGWEIAAESGIISSTGFVWHRGPPGYYVWGVHLVYGSGEFTLTFKRPDRRAIAAQDMGSCHFSVDAVFSAVSPGRAQAVTDE